MRLGMEKKSADWINRRQTIVDFARALRDGARHPLRAGQSYGIVQIAQEIRPSELPA